jgi:hypothetical protein
VIPKVLYGLTILAAGFSGLLAGASADRYLVQVPAWRQLDVMIWAEYSRHADLGNGRFWYPPLAFAATGLSIAAAAAVYTRPTPIPGLAPPVYLAAACEIGGLTLTILAAPNLIRLRGARDPAAAERSFRLFHRWGLPRAILQIVAFPILLWAIWVLVRT